MFYARVQLWVFVVIADLVSEQTFFICQIKLISVSLNNLQAIQVNGRDHMKSFCPPFKTFVGQGF